LGINQAKSTNKEQNRRENSERKGIRKNEKIIIHPLGAKTIYTSGVAFNVSNNI
jgi:hypothetical protein